MFCGETGGDARLLPKEKAGNLSRSPCRALDSSFEPRDIAEVGLLPVALEKDDGADEDEGEALAGKTKLGRGRGPGLFSRGGVWEPLSVAAE